MRNLHLLCTALLVTSVGLSAAPDAAAQAPPQAVITDVVREVPVQRRERFIGSLRAASTATLAALEEGPLVDVLVKEAEAVPAGGLLARTDTRRLAAQLREQKARIAEVRANITARRAELENQRRDVSALEAAARENAVSERDLRNARTAVESGEATLRATEQTLAALEAVAEFLEVRISDAEIRAPFAARVIERHAEPGEWVRPGDPLVTLQSVGTLEAWLEVPERYLESLVADPEQTHVELTAGGVRSVTRLRVLPRVDERARTFYLIADIEDPDGELSPGMSVTSWVPFGPSRGERLVPKDALVRRDRSTYVMRVVAGDGGAHVEPVEVAIRFELARHCAVEPGTIAAGDELVIEGNERLLPGAAVVARRTEAPTRLVLPGAASDPASAPSDS